MHLSGLEMGRTICCKTGVLMSTVFVPCVERTDSLYCLGVLVEFATPKIVFIALESWSWLLHQKFVLLL